MAFWTNGITKCSDGERLRRSMEERPLPGAYGHATVALGKMIRSRIKAKEDPSELLRILFSVLCEDALLNSVGYDPDLQMPGFNISESIPRRRLDSLKWPYEKIGLTTVCPGPTAAKWFTKYLGQPPSPGMCAFTFHRDVWEQARAKLLLKHSAPYMAPKRRIRAIPIPAREGAPIEVHYDFATPGSVGQVTLTLESWDKKFMEQRELSPSTPSATVALPRGHRQIWIQDLSGQTSQPYIVPVLQDPDLP